MSTQEIELTPNEKVDEAGALAAPGIATLPADDEKVESTAALDAEVAPKRSSRQEWTWVLTLCWAFFLIGWNSAGLGPLLPRIQEFYGINYTVVSMLFVSQCCGTIPGSLSSGYLTDKLGFGKLVALGAALQLITYPAISAAPPFPALCVIYVVNGLSGAFQSASCNIFVSSLVKNKANYLGVLHASFGLGALVSPLVATQFAQMPRHWSFHFIISAVFALINNILVIVVFKYKTQDYFIPEAAARRRQAHSSGRKYREIIKLWRVHLMAVFIFIYVGAEITTGGWIYTYLLKYRGAGPSAGYVSSGFFGGLMLGRLILLPINKWIGPERVIFLYSAIALALELTIWFVPSVIENAVAVSFVGVVFGPFYPILLNVASRTLPEQLFAGAVGWITAMGQTGSALFPFLVGALASKYGVQVLQPLAVAMMSALAVIWFVVLRSKAHTEE